MQVRMEYEKFRKEGTKVVSDDYFRRGWLQGYESEKRRLLKQKEEEELKKKINLDLSSDLRKFQNDMRDHLRAAFDSEVKELKKKQEEVVAEKEEMLKLLRKQLEDENRLRSEERLRREKNEKEELRRQEKEKEEREKERERCKERNSDLIQDVEELKVVVSELKEALRRKEKQEDEEDENKAKET